MSTATARILGRTPDAAALGSDLEAYRLLALERGASAAAVVPACDVIVDERVRLKCVIPRCVRAGETPHCPPHGLELELVRRAFARFAWAILFKCDVAPLADYLPGRGQSKEEQRRVLAFHKQSGEVVDAIERRAYKDGYHLAMGLGGGSCKDYLCHGIYCQALDSGRCRFPQRARPAMEAAGIDVIDLLNKVGWESYALLDDLDQIPCAVTVGIVFIV